MLKAHEIVRLWEVAAGKPIWQKAILTLSAAHPDEPVENLAMLSLGNRNAGLFRLRDQLLGTQMNANSFCPECTEPVEFHLDSQVICNPELPPCNESEFHLNVDGCDIVCRPVNSCDLRDVMPVFEAEGPESAEEELIIKCIFSVSRGGVKQPVLSLSSDVLKNIGAAVREKDVHSEIICRLSCPECSHSWAEPFDIARYFWQELEVKAQIILSEVQILARAFGWWEGDILSLSDIRRKYYLEALDE